MLSLWGEGRVTRAPDAVRCGVTWQGTACGKGWQFGWGKSRLWVALNVSDLR